MLRNLRAALWLIAVVAVPMQAQIGGLIKKKITDELSKKSADSVKRADSVKHADSLKRVSTDSARTTTTAKPDPKIWENYDFIPGSKVLFYTDFSEDRVGNFARGLKYRSGPAEVVQRDTSKVLRATGPAEFLIPLGHQLPQRFTLELDAIAPQGGVMNPAVQFEGGAETDDKFVKITWNPQGAWLYGARFNMANGGTTVPEAMRAMFAGNVVHLRVLMDSGYLKMYANERRLYNVPELPFKRDSVIRVSLGGGEDPNAAVYLTSIRVAESETDVMYDALLAKGRWVTQGILFATGKADVQPESRPVLKEIAATMKAHADLKILIEGHTDNVGTPAGNLTLSDARAAAVKATLVSDYGIDAARITTKGLGDTKPAVPNSTAAGRAQNRRVEVVKQ